MMSGRPVGLSHPWLPAQRQWRHRTRQWSFSLLSRQGSAKVSRVGTGLLSYLEDPSRVPVLSLSRCLQARDLCFLLPFQLGGSALRRQFAGGILLSLLCFLVFFFGLHPVIPESLSGQFQIVQFLTSVPQLTLVVSLLVLSVGGPRLQPVERSKGDTLPSNSFLSGMEVWVDDLHEFLN